MQSELEQVYERIHKRELAARERVCAENKTFSAVDVASALKPPMSIEIVEDWRRSRRIFAFSHHGLDRYPAFQFKDGVPLTAIERVLGHLGGVEDSSREPPWSDWATMFWFVSANGWLEGLRPIDLLHSDPDAVTVAASHARDLVSD